MNGLISRKEVGKMLGVSGATVSKLIREGQLGAVRVGHQVRISEAGVQEFVQSNLMGKVSETGCCNAN